MTAMDLKTFEGATRAQAMARLHEALGPDAHIVTIRETGDQVTVTGTRAARTADLETLLMPQESPAPKDDLKQALVAHNVPEPVLSQLLQQAQAFPHQELARLLSQLFDRALTFAPIAEPPKAMILFGPTGAGKTATLVRLAARFRAQDQRVSVVTTDVARTGATRHLQTLLAPLEIEPVVAETRDELSYALDRFCGSSILIDSTGVNPLQAAELASLAGLIDGLPVEPVLVVPVGMDALDTRDMAGNSKALGARRAITTKLDAARRLGNVLSVASAELALAETTISPLLGKPLVPWSAQGLAKVLSQPVVMKGAKS